MANDEAGLEIPVAIPRRAVPEHVCSAPARVHQYILLEVSTREVQRLQPFLLQIPRLPRRLQKHSSNRRPHTRQERLVPGGTKHDIQGQHPKHSHHLPWRVPGRFRRVPDLLPLETATCVPLSANVKVRGAPPTDIHRSRRPQTHPEISKTHQGGASLDRCVRLWDHLFLILRIYTHRLQLHKWQLRRQQLQPEQPMLVQFQCQRLRGQDLPSLRWPYLLLRMEQ